jgi:cytochrome c oxidase cbb3-type subunit IV
MGVLLSFWTLFVVVVFFGVVIWAWSRRRKAEFDAAARIPLEDDDVNGDDPHG